MGLVLWIAPVIAVILSRIVNNTKQLHIISVCASFIMLLAAGFVTNSVVSYGTLTYKFFVSAFYIDAVSIIVLDITITIGFLVSIYSIGYLDEELKHKKTTSKKIKFYYSMMYVFIFSMVLALTVNNIGIMWVAIEATTLATAFLVGFNNDEHALEAAWKYVIICSVGIAMALVGIIFLHLASIDVVSNENALQWDLLYNNAKDLNSSVLRLSFIFILIGFGTKAGLAPMHTWLPDAHSQAPSPISALLSGVLLNGAMYAALRILAIVNRNLDDSGFTGKLMIAFGLLSISAAAVFIITQKDYKRLLAYSSIEHMGIIAVAFGLFTPLSVFAGFFHMINHSFTKSMLFLASGNILQKYNTRKISKIRGLLKILPVSGTAFLIGLLAVSGTPPFSIFASEVNVFLSIFSAEHYILGAVFVLLLAFIFAGIAFTLFRVFYGEPQESQYIRRGETNKPGTAVLIVLMLIIAGTGLYMPGLLKDLITSAQMIIIGG
ncbi:MAG: hydrogenase 4 subunit F [Eubacteriales bacterium]|nr:hydrogenase 4 subunit F [Eubacteriales bacterium]MDD3198721.1 hydrogenase 4 subunit F [Eubacteriales bacterium]MDD4629033.1 hydrogenase 4 subunit F [Eubacteriales bacterium]